MTIWKTLMIVTPLAMTTAAWAGPSRLSDAQYIAAQRCEGLMTSAALGRQDTRDLEARLKAESVSRSSDAYDRADQARDDAQRAASHAGPYAKAALIAERDGPCRSLMGAGTMSAAAAPAAGTRTN